MHARSTYFIGPKIRDADDCMLAAISIDWSVVRVRWIRGPKEGCWVGVYPLPPPHLATQKLVLTFEH
jgi:hypothetical protein